MTDTTSVEPDEPGEQDEAMREEAMMDEGMTEEAGTEEAETEEALKHRLHCYRAQGLRNRKVVDSHHQRHNSLLGNSSVHASRRVDEETRRQGSM